MANQLKRFVSLNPHQLVGQVANLEFWIDEVRHAFGVIDGYRRRFERLRDAQTNHVRSHLTIQFVPGDIHRTATDPPGPHKVPDAELKEARRALGDATYRFLIRCYKAGFMTKKQVRTECDRVGIGIDAADLDG